MSNAKSYDILAWAFYINYFDGLIKLFLDRYPVKFLHTLTKSFFCEKSFFSHNLLLNILQVT